ncbi:MAG: hypothetical protein NTV63_02675 [Candidatus Woesearchaeota archaeon]|nr:hypothetical protein [Candidatus Woesearchaeota archaeon]
MKCEICKNRIEEGFLGKIKGAYVKDEKGRMHPICFECQKKFLEKKEIIKNL